jgi:shikimate kinase/shikimate 5-dehydrogenase
MKKVFIGHRGVGKSALLKRHQMYFPEISHYDLDIEIEKAQSESILNIFAKYGEPQFRKIEKKIFDQLIQESNFIISLGAGFDSSIIPTDIEVILISRRTDTDGRIFLNRPQLNAELSALEEYDFRFNKREPFFRSRTDFVYHMPEGLIEENSIEEKVFSRFIQLKNAFVTLLPEQILLLEKFSDIELRTDLFSDLEIQNLVQKYTNRFLISYRKNTQDLSFKSGCIDWALELGPVPAELYDAELIVSNHDDKISDAICKFASYPQFHQKLCPVINLWDELMTGHQWQSEKPDQRSFLPRTNSLSKKSKWRWYRQLQLSNQKINFIQGHQDLDDQPSLYEYLNLKLGKRFAAVLGDPVHHSKTPITQGHKIHLNVLAIPLLENEFDSAMAILQKIGLTAGAVTSPLKVCAGRLCGEKRSLNTIVYRNNQWIGTSTDEFGLEKSLLEIKNFKNKKIVVWGGGGTLALISEIVPHAVFYSAQTQEARDNNRIIENPDILIWAAPRKSGIQWPDLNWKPEYVLDLNYVENSQGLEYALKIKTKYISGDTMFYAQAEKQLQFWIENLKD